MSDIDTFDVNYADSGACCLYQSNVLGKYVDPYILLSNKDNKLEIPVNVLLLIYIFVG